MMLAAVDFPLLNAFLNSLATALLVSGFVMIKRRRETAHKWLMVSAFVVSVLFLVCYLIYHYSAGHVEFSGPPPISYFYYAMLASHIILAMLVPVLAITTIVLAIMDRRAGHRRIARITFPIWLYVSVTGVLIYLMLYQLYPGEAAAP